MEFLLKKRMIVSIKLLYPSSSTSDAGDECCKEKGLLEFWWIRLEKYLKIPYTGVSIKTNLPDSIQRIAKTTGDHDTALDKSKVLGIRKFFGILKDLCSTHFNFWPGEKYEYKHTGYVLLASNCGKSLWKRFRGSCQMNGFFTAGMKSTAIRSPKERLKVSNFAAGHLQMKQEINVNANKFQRSDYTGAGQSKGPGRVK